MQHYVHFWRAVSVIHLLYNSRINIGVTANKNMFDNNVQTLSGSIVDISRLKPIRIQTIRVSE